MLTIKSGMSLLAVQNMFNGAFPYLKLGFFRKVPGLKDPRAARVVLKPDLLLRSTAKDSTGLELIIKSEMSVLEVEQLFLDRFGLLAQIFRKSGRSWLETKLTDDWSLKKQNDEGSELSEIF